MFYENVCRPPCIAALPANFQHVFTSECVQQCYSGALLFGDLHTHSPLTERDCMSAWCYHLAMTISCRQSSLHKAYMKYKLDRPSVTVDTTDCTPRTLEPCTRDTHAYEMEF